MDDRVQPTPETTEHPLTDPPQGISVDDVDREQAIRAALSGATFPATREGLLDHAAGAREAVVVDLRSLGDGSRYESYEELLVALGVGSSGRIDVPGAPPRGGYPATGQG